MISKARLKNLSSLKQKRIRDRERKFLAEGLRLCEEILDSNYQIESALFCKTLFESDRAHRLLNRFERHNIPLDEISARDLKHLSDTVQSQGIVCIVRKREFDFAEILKARPSLLLSLDQISDPGNLGTIIRTASWFGVGGILLGSNAVDPTNPKVIRASMGGLFTVPIFEECVLEEKVATLKNAGYAIWATDPSGDIEYHRADFEERNLLILGNEVSGIAPEIRAMVNATLKIPKLGRGESLNVAVAAGILLAEMSREAS